MLCTRNLLLLALVIAAVATRLVPHVPNVTPVVAIALFGGATFSSRRVAFTVPLLAMLVSDVMIGWISGAPALGLHAVMPFVYAALVMITAIGLRTRSRRAGPLAGATLLSSLVFFVVTNLGVFLVGGLYPRDGAGLVACYVAALPFFRNAVIGDLAYASALFGAFAFAEHLARRSAPRVLVWSIPPESDRDA